VTLLNPFGLIGLLSLPVILSFHLLRERQRRTIVSHLKLWSFLDSEVRGPRARRIPITWILLLDLLIATLISLAWSQPQVSVLLPAFRQKHLVILLDISSSMRTMDGPVSRFDRAKADAIKLMDSRGARDPVTIVSFGQRASIVADSRTDNALQLQEKITGLKAGETGYSLQDALALAQSSLDKLLPAEIHIITDGAFPGEELIDFDEIAYPMLWKMVGTALDNQAVIEINATQIDEGRLQIFTRFVNFGSSPVSRLATLLIDGRPIDQNMIELPPETSVPRVWQTTIQPSENPVQVMVNLEGTDPFREDDRAVIGLQSGGITQVALVSDNPSTLQLAILAFPGVDLEVISPEDYSSSRFTPGENPSDLTIFQKFLPETLPEGQVLIVEPPTLSNDQDNSLNPQIASLQSISLQEIPANSSVEFPNPNPLVEGIDFNGVRWSKAWTLASPPTGFVPLLRVGDIPLVLVGQFSPNPPGVSRVVVLLADLSQGNFTKHPAFPILMANMIEFSRSAPLPPRFNTGETLLLPPPGNYQSVQVTPPNQPAIVMNSPWPSEWSQTVEPGLYRFSFTRADGKIDELFAGANTGDEVESDIRPRAWTQEVIGGIPVSGRDTVQEEQSVDLRTWLLGAAVLLLLVEAVLAWRR